jgi:hypothetical protein
MMRLVSLVVCSGLIGCATTSIEQRLVGAWREPFDQYEDEAGVVHRRHVIAENTLRPDHTYTSGLVGHRVVTGHWRVSGRYLIYEYPSRSKGQIVKRDRVKIVRLSERELILADDDGRRRGEWTKAR